jgi:hypothetical protein
MSKNPIVYCGDRCIKWADFEEVIRSIFAIVINRVPRQMFF